MSTEPAVAPQRIDQWLFFSRLVKTRTLAAGLVEGGKVRVNKERITKASTLVRQGDVLTMAIGARVRVIEVLGSGSRRRPAAEAQLLYNDLSPAQPRADMDGSVAPSVPQRAPGAGRPTKRDRRALDRLEGND